jgi:hypothetical protein
VVLTVRCPSFKEAASINLIPRPQKSLCGGSLLTSTSSGSKAKAS